MEALYSKVSQVPLFGLPLFGEAKTIKLPNDYEEVALVGEGERILEALNKALSESKTSHKSIYPSWVRYFTHSLKAGARRDIEFKAMPVYWFSWYISGPGISLCTKRVQRRREVLRELMKSLEKEEAPGQIFHDCPESKGMPSYILFFFLIGFLAFVSSFLNFDCNFFWISYLGF